MSNHKYKYIYPKKDVFNSSIKIEQVLALICENNGSKFFCPNGHSKPQRIQVYKTPNLCKCHNCGEVKGSPVDIAKWHKGGNFIEGLKWLSDNFGIQKVLNPEYIDEKGQTLSSEELKKAQESIGALQKVIEHEVKETMHKVEYLDFDVNKDYCKVDNIEKFMPSQKIWLKLDNIQKLKVVYTWFYRETFKYGSQEAKYIYYKKRGLDTENRWLSKISYLSVDNFNDVFDKASALFPIEVLEQYGFVKKDEYGDYNLSFSYVKKGGILIVPSFDLYTDMVVGFMLRPTHPEQWMKDRHMKEIQLSSTSVLHPLPFGLTYYSLKKFNEFYVTEGHPDGLALPDNGKKEKGRGFFSVPGVNGLNESHLGLLKGKEIIICFDQDRAGQKSAFGYTVIECNGQRYDFINKLEDFKRVEKINSLKNSGIEFREIAYQGLSSKLEKAGILYSIKQWDTKFGSDVNDVRINGNLSKVF